MSKEQMIKELKLLKNWDTTYSFTPVIADIQELNDWTLQDVKDLYNRLIEVKS